MTKSRQNPEARVYGFSLIELLAVLVISMLVVISAVAVYSQMQSSARQIDSIITSRQLPTEILQRIAQDLDRIVAPLSGRAADAKISVKNKFDGSYESAQLKITRTYLDDKNQKQVFEEITWQSNYDFAADSLILYRSHTGLTVEDNVLSENKTRTEDSNGSSEEVFVPIAAGLTCFKIDCLAGKDFVETWTAETLPKVIRINISFAAPDEDARGNLVVPEDQMIARTVAIDRTRQVKFEFIPPDINELELAALDANAFEPADANDLDEFDDVNDVNFLDEDDSALDEPDEE